LARFKSKPSNREPRSWSVAELGAFYVANRSEFITHANRILKESARAEEVVQDAFMKVVLAAPELESKEHALAYVHRTIENLCIDIFRLESRRPNLVLLDDVTAEVERNWTQAADLSESLVGAEDAAIVRQALSLLSPAERAALVMWEIEGRSTKEIARELGVKESSVRHTVSRARNSLKRILTELVIDEKRGYTALDLLSKSYRKSVEVAKKGSKVALSLVLVFFAFLGFNSIPNPSLELTSQIKEPNSESTDTKPSVQVTNSDKSFQETVVKSSDKTPKLTSSVANMKASPLKFPGLDKNGVPTGFTVSDSTGSLGSASFFERTTIATETDLSIGQILKTDAGAANIFLSQTLTTDSSGLSYRPTLSFGQSGYWVPLLVKVSSMETTRQMNGNYLFTAYIAVESAIETPIKIAATASGRDLAGPPKQVITRLVLDPSKTKVLAQAIQVIEREAKA